MADPEERTGTASDESTTRTDDHYECAHCGATFGEWTEDCPECDQLVVRIVVR